MEKMQKIESISEDTSDITRFLDDPGMVRVIRAAIQKEIEYRALPSVSIVGEHAVDIGQTVTRLQLGMLALEDAPGFYRKGSGFGVKLDQASQEALRTSFSQSDS